MSSSSTQNLARARPAHSRERGGGPRVAALVAVLGASAGLFAGAGCKAKDDARARPAVELRVFAASSLTEAFEDLAEGFEAANPEVDVQLSFAGSQALRLQIEQGATAEVFASANATHMQALVDAGLVEGAATFASNELVVIVPIEAAPGTQAITTFDALDDAERVVIGAPEVPVGAYTRTLLDRAEAALGEDFVAKIRSHVVSEESNVRLVRAKVELGEADAAVVYRTDAAASDTVRTIAIPGELGVRAGYEIGVVAGSPQATQARAFVAYVRSTRGRALLEARGFTIEEDAGVGGEREARP
ncbi:molybdate ABC transporter substrate-binding protein [Pseudenhygromyxa sp. WMMC2535]|uniref:molybdate ABC transporter substrate-binding protein n=1 Tax=Pseudenhygromyxa sp. WMMC2535 TaxID=2712867 RepID=UPI001558224C|nr:molybdate ABC transporter substrate-binding protein [Pseudenhygromyxa sp. WMMC2535]NVB42615.1 molybdate ABC transporter substrate-binding protein [Pseudenhygromyxa sp. WMMC2535]